MNWRRGSTRLAIIYFVFWFLVGAYGTWQQNEASQRFLEVSRDPRGMAWELAFWNDRAQLGVRMMKAAGLWGIVVPIVGAILAPIGFWIWKGFRPAEQPSATRMQHEEQLRK